MSDKTQTAILLSEEARELMRRFGYVDKARSRNAWINMMVEFRDELDKMPAFKDKTIEYITNILKSIYNESERNGQKKVRRHE